MRNLDELNLNEGGRVVTRKPPTVAQIEAFESHFGVVLPEDYVTMLRHSNGGHPELNAFKPKGLVADFLWDVNHFYFLDDDKDDLEGVWASTKAYRKVLRTNVIAIGNDGGDNQLLLSFQQNPPSVQICLHDEEMRIIHVADSFGEFIDMLREDPSQI